MPATTPHLHWGAEELWQRLCTVLPGVSVEVLARVESTNTRLLERARASSGDPDAPVTRPGELDALPPAERSPYGRRTGDISPCLLVAEQQTRGRGRMGRSWVSHVGASLTFSLSMPLAPRHWGGLSLAVGLALAEALDPGPAAGPGHVALKWPNDLCLTDGPGRGRKLGGILIETLAVGDSRMCVVGVGLNVLPQPAGSARDMAKDLASGYACLQEIDPGASAPAALAQVALPLVLAMQRFQAEGFAPLVAAYARRDMLLGHAVNVQTPDALQGVAEGVDEHGALLVRSGSMHRVISGEVSVRLAGIE